MQLIQSMPSKALTQSYSAFFKAFFAPVDSSGIDPNSGNAELGWIAGSVKISVCIAAAVVVASLISHLQ